MSRIYLDNAATSFPKPEAVYQAVDGYQRHLGAAAGRGEYRAAGQAGRIVATVRRNLARLLGAAGPERIALAFNGTDALNMALWGLLRPGDHVVTTAAEHNSVLRPLRAMGDFGVEVSMVGLDECGRVPVDALRRALRPETRLLAVTGASNVTGAVQPIAELAEIARERRIFSLVDAAQTAGHDPIDLARLPVDLLACPGHKGLLGPLGTGVLYVREGVEEHLRSFRQGGTGTESASDRQPRAMPELLEAGNLNLVGLAGLAASAEWLLARGVPAIGAAIEELTGLLIDGLARHEAVHLIAPPPPGERIGLVSIRVDGWDPAELAGLLDAEFGIETRAGLHCAGAMHRHLGTADQGGTLRVSLGALSSGDDVRQFLAAIGEIVGEI